MSKRKTAPDGADTEPLTMSVDEYARAANFGRSTIYGAIQRGELPVIRVGRSVRLPRWLLDPLKRPTAVQDDGEK